MNRDLDLSMIQPIDKMAVCEILERASLLLQPLATVSILACRTK